MKLISITNDECRMTKREVISGAAGRASPRAASSFVIRHSSFVILLVAALLLPTCGGYAADQIVEATITVTNFNGIATNGSAFLTVNGATRTATNNVAANPALYFLG